VNDLNTHVGGSLRPDVLWKKGGFGSEGNGICGWAICWLGSSLTVTRDAPVYR
jgi:hypothetical protein